MTGFGGFPPETTRFLLELRANNHKGWLEAHRADYEVFWLAPARAFVLAAGGLLAELAPGIRTEPSGLGSTFRINRDTRFTRDPRPYKDHIDFWSWEGARRRAVSGLSPAHPRARRRRRQLPRLRPGAASPVPAGGRRDRPAAPSWRGSRRGWRPPANLDSREPALAESSGGGEGVETLVTSDFVVGSVCRLNWSA